MFYILIQILIGGKNMVSLAVKEDLAALGLDENGNPVD